MFYELCTHICSLTFIRIFLELKSHTVVKKAWFYEFSRHFYTEASREKHNIETSISMIKWVLNFLLCVYWFFSYVCVLLVCFPLWHNIHFFYQFWLTSQYNCLMLDMSSISCMNVLMKLDWSLCKFHKI